jgi:predicted lipid-binding transport protein (Tim44 family)
LVHAPHGGFRALLNSNFIKLGVCVLLVSLSMGGTVLGAQEGWRMAKFPGTLLGALVGDFIGLVIFLLCAFLIDWVLRRFRARSAHESACSD